MRRVLVLLLVLLVVVVVAAIGAVHWVLQSDWPRQLVVSTAQQQTGLRIEVGTLRATWGGVTTLEDVTVALPLEDDAFASVPRMVVRHNGVLSLLLSGGSVRVEAVEIAEPTVRVREERGRWNVAEAVATVMQHLPSSEEGGALPRVTVAGGRVMVEGEDGVTELSAVTLTGSPLGEVAWTFEGSAEDVLKVSGRLTPWGDMAHEVTVEASPSDAMVSQWLAGVPVPVRLRGDWTGRVEAGVVRGVATIEEGRAGGFGLRGEAGVTVEGAEVAVMPEGLVVTGVEQLPGEVRGSGGPGRVRGAAVTGSRVGGAVEGTRAELNGAGRLDTQTGWLEGSWSAMDSRWAEALIAGAGDATHGGTVTARVERPGLDRVAAEVGVTMRGRSVWGAWEGELTAKGAGGNWDAMVWEVGAPRMRLTRDEAEPIVLDGFAATVAMRWPVVVVERLRTGAGLDVAASGEVDVDTLTWRGEVRSEALTLPGVAMAPVAVVVEADGVGARAQVTKLEATLGPLRVEGTGTYDPEREQSLDATVKATVDLTVDGAMATATPATGTGEAGEQAASVTMRPERTREVAWAGRWVWDGTVTGRPQGRDVTAVGTLVSDSVVINHQPLAEVTLPLEVRLRDEVVALRSQRFELFDGSCELEGAYRFGGTRTRLKLEARDFSLQRVARFANPELKVEGKWDGTLDVIVPHERLQDMRVEGTVAIDGFSTGPIAFDRMTGRLTTRRSVLRFDDVQLHKGEGSAVGSASFDLGDPRMIRAELRSDGWPLEVAEAGLSARIDGSTNLDIDVVTGDAYGSMTVDTQVFDGEKALAEVSFDGTLTPQSLQVRALQGTVLGATVEGQGMFDRVQWHRSTGSLTYRDLALSSLAHWLDEAGEATGRVSGEVSFGPADEARPLEPVRIDAQVTATDASWRGLDFSGGHATAYAGRRRVVVNDSRFGIADGSVSVWSSLTRREAQWFSNVRVDFEDLDLQRLRAAMLPDDEPAVGRISGFVSFVGDVRKWYTAVGNGRVDVSASDLASIDIIGAVFRAMGVSMSRPEPTGFGRAVFRFESALVQLESFKYFNRGVDMQLQGTVFDLKKGWDSPLLLFAAGTFRPLKNLPIPGTEVLDEIFTNVQLSIATVRADGTLGRPNARPVPLSETSRTLRELIGVSEPDRAGEASPGD